MTHCQRHRCYPWHSLCRFIIFHYRNRVHESWPRNVKIVNYQGPQLSTVSNCVSYMVLYTRSSSLTPQRRLWTALFFIRCRPPYEYGPTFLHMPPTSIRCMDWHFFIWCRYTSYRVSFFTDSGQSLIIALWTRIAFTDKQLWMELSLISYFGIKSSNN